MDPSHLDAVATNADLLAAFPEASKGEVKSLWRGPKSRLLGAILPVGSCHTRVFGYHILGLGFYRWVPPKEVFGMSLQVLLKKGFRDLGKGCLSIPEMKLVTVESCVLCPCSFSEA